MKKYLLCFLLPIVALSCNSGPSAEDYYKMGVEKLKHKPTPEDKVRVFKEAIADFDKAIELNPEYVEALGRRAVLKRALHDYNGSIQDAEKITSIDPKNNLYWSFIGQTKSFNKDYKGVVAAYNKAIAIDSTKSQYYNDRGSAEQELNDLTAALKDFTHGIAIGADNDPFKKYMYLSRGQIELKMQNKAAACADFYKSLSLGSEFAQFYIDNNCK